jgi:hypothetical protein
MTHISQVFHCNRGQTKSIPITTYNSAGTLADPSTSLTATVLSPLGGTTDYVQGTADEWSKSSTGTYTFKVTPTVGHEKPWQIRFVAVSGSDVAVSIAELYVEDDDFA